MRRGSKFRSRAAWGYAIVILIVAIPATLALASAYVAARARDHFTAKQVERVERAGELGRKAWELTAASWTYEPLAGPRREFERALRGLREDAEELEDDERLDRVRRKAEQYVTTLERLRTAQDGPGQADVALLFSREVLPLHYEFVHALDAHVAHERRRIDPVRERADAALARALVVSAGAFLVAVGVSVPFAQRSIRELKDMYELERRTSGSAERALAARDEIQRIVAHDLRDPLNAIAMRAALIRSKSDAREAREHAGAIEDVAARMGHLMKMLVDGESIGEGRLTVDSAPVDLTDVLRRTFDLFETQARAKDVRLRIDLERAGIGVRADRERLVDALSNVVSNAIRFTPGGGEVAVSARSDEELVHVVVSDTGPGIAPDHLPHVFERSYSASSSAEKSTGLGLYIASSIVEAHGGRIWAESPPGEGATFHFTLPRADLEREVLGDPAGT